MWPAFLRRKTTAALINEESGVSDPRAEIKAWRTVLVQEQVRLGADLTQLLETYERSLNFFVAHISELDEASLQRERASLESLRGILGNAIRRLEVSCKDHQELLNEWQEWQAIEQLATHPLDTQQQKRIEMLRSEMQVRGLLPKTTDERLQQNLKQQTNVTQSQEKKTEAKPEVRMPSGWSGIQISDEDELDDWAEIANSRAESSASYWAGYLQELLAQPVIDERSVVQVAKELRQAQALLKRHDRQEGIERFRIEIFET